MNGLAADKLLGRTLTQFGHGPACRDASHSA